MLSTMRGRLLISSHFYVLRGAMFLRQHQALWKYAAAPVAISIVVLSIAYYLLYRFFVLWIGRVVGEGWYWQVLYYVVIVIGAALVLVVFFFLLKDSVRGVGHFFRILGVYLGILVASLFLLLVPGIGPMLFAGAMVLNTSYMLAYEYLGYPMDRRRFTFKQKRLFLKSHVKWTMGFGLGNATLASIPVLNVVVIPAAVVGGTLLFLDLTAPTAGTHEMDRS
jgi:CysZ protein